MDNQFDLDNPSSRQLLSSKPYESFNQCEESNSRMIVIGEITSIEVLMKLNYEFLNINNSSNYGNKKQSRSSSYFSNQDEDDDDLIDDFNNGQSSNFSIIKVYRSFKSLKDRLNKNLNVLMDHSYLKPFCELIMNKDMSGRITAVALGSLLKFLNYGLIDYTENQGSAQLLCETMIKVRFISTNTNNDEVVLMRILLLIKELLTRGFNLINNRTLYGMIRTCFRVIFEPNLSELLRKNAEHTLIDIVRMLFMRLDEFKDSQRLLNLEPGIRSIAISAKESPVTVISKDDKDSKELKTDEEQIKQENQKTDFKPQQKCYDLECIYDLFNYLAQIVNPNETNNTLMSNQVGLNVLIVVFETSVNSIGQKASLMKIVKNELCWSLVNIIKSDKQLTLFSLGLRLSSIIFLHLRMQLKYQFQEMLIKVIEILSSSLTASQEYKDIAIDYLHTFFLQIPFLPHELFINFDCDPYALNILEDLLNLLSKNCFLNSKLTNIQSTGDSDVPVFNFVKKMSFNLLLLILKSLQKAELIADFVLMPNLSENSHFKLRKLFDKEKDELNDDEERILRNFFLPSTREQIIYLKERKKLIWEASENFNAKPSKGITFLQEKKLIENNQDLIKFLRENTRLDKKELGDYLSNRKNQEILEQFVQSFNFINLRLDDALRLFLESFRLPGEAPLISFLLEQFANHWFESNNRPFANVDSAFALSYAIIMLNTDQHNSNVRQSMTCDDFTRNLRGVNGGQDFDQDMLKSIYHAIHKNKIITPAEQQGIIREQYLWKCMLTKSESYLGIYYYATKSKIDNQETKTSQLAFLNGSIFEILWGPSISSLTFLFDKINMNMKTGLLEIILNQGFTSCAFLCARYGHLDDLIVSLCKFTINSAGGPMNPLLYPKSQKAALCLFNITKEYSNYIRESWKNIIEIILNWFKGKFLDDMFEVEDFALNGKSIKLKRKINCKSNRKNIAENSSNIFTGFFQFFSGNDRNELDQLDCSLSSRSLDDESGNKNQLKYIYEQPLNILKDSKFFQFDSLIELIKAIISVNVEFVDELGDDVEVFKLELLFQIIFLNRDRVAILWTQISDYLVKLLKSCEASEFLSERTISAIFRLAIRFISRPEKLSNQIFELMQKAMRTLSAKQFQRNYTALAIYTFITHSHCYLSTTDEWKLINEIILYVGINYKIEPFIPSNLDIALSSTEEINIQSDQETLSSEFEKLSTVVQQRGYTSDSEIDLNKQQQFNQPDFQQQNLANPFQLMTGKSISLGRDSCFRIRDVNAYERCIEILNLIVKDIIPKYVQLNCEQTMTNQNLTGIIENCIDTLRKFVEASIRIQSTPTFTSSNSIAKRTNSYKDSNRKRYESMNKSSNQLNNLTHQHSLTLLTDSETELDIDTDIDHPDYKRKLKERRLYQAKIVNSTENCCIKLLELMHFLHINVNFINQNVQDKEHEIQESDKKTLTFDYLWTYIWCPLLQGIALLCCDERKKIRLNAYTYLERELLNPELKSLTSQQWENCFNKVLFPLLAKLLEQVNQSDLNDMDETRERVTSLLSKVYLQHLSSLYTLSTFTALWLTILEFMEKYMKAEMKTELVKEAIPQRLKNMLQVMINANCLNDELSSITWDRIHCFLPNLKNEIIEPPQPTISPTQSIQSIGSTNVQQNIQQNLSQQTINQEHQQQSPIKEHQSSFNYNSTDYQSDSNQPTHQSIGDAMFVQNFSNNDYLNQYCMINNYNMHGSNQSMNQQQTKSAESHSNQQQINLNQDKSNYNTQQSSPNFVDQSIIQSNYSNYPQHFHQTEHHIINQPTVYSASAPNYNQIHQQTDSLGMSPPIYSQPLSPTGINQQYSQTYYSQSSHNTVNKVIEMPQLQSSLNMNEGMYQELQQQKTFATSTTYSQDKSLKYPWPQPR